MSDHDFDFRRPTQRRAAKTFEPPPWEKEAFEEFQRRRAQSEQADTAADPSPEAGAVRPDAGPVIAPRPAGPRDESAAATVAAEAIEAPGREVHCATAKPEVDESVVIELMAGLAAEEPSLQPTVERVSLVSALVIAAIGTVMILWGMAALVGSRVSGPLGAFGGSVLLFFGAVAIAGAVWLTVRTLRQRGVL